ncbi:hypothetical protein TcasGA2_TC015115 [Tribolium castaneum]|uniref:Uncharacterized protein n=1 Tax=Tribolium castaneum TaxID=7070 RepID=D2A5T1_TRICA|nr:hypothetical protein TcasGA2_TC015115 [Tribolium castaneum]
MISAKSAEFSLILVLSGIFIGPVRVSDDWVNPLNAFQCIFGLYVGRYWPIRAAGLFVISLLDFEEEINASGDSQKTDDFL